MTRPLISAIIPTYNRSEMIGRAVGSVLDQTWEHLECIVIDDGSSDDTQDVLAEFDDPRLLVIRQENKGVSAARNVGITHATGEFLALLDSDDHWLPKKLDTQVRYMLAHGLDISQTDEIWFRKGRRVNQGFKHAKPEGMFFERSLEMCLVSPSCVMFTVQFWNEFGPFDESLPACEDYDLWLRACLYRPVGLVREQLTVKHGGRPDQLSNSVPCLDLYRMKAIVKIMSGQELDTVQRDACRIELEKKARIYVQGCRKRGRGQEADRVWTLVCNILGGKPFTPDQMV